MSDRRRRALPHELTAEQKALYEKIALGPRAAESAFPLVDEGGALTGPFDAMLLAPQIGDALQSLGSALRFGGSLPDRARELVILAVAHHRSSDFEIYAHEAVARRIGIPDTALEQIVAGGIPEDADAFELAALTVTYELLRGGGLDDAAWMVAQKLGDPVVFEISTLVGYYSLLALQLEVFPPDVADRQPRPTKEG